jgi:hypothetical protein
MKPGFYGPRSRANATLLIGAATSLGYPTSVVKTARNGYTAPQDVIDAALGISAIEEGVTYPAPPEPAPEGQAEGSTTVEKPRGNASREAWADYVGSLGIPVGGDLSRDDIKNLVNEEE